MPATTVKPRYAEASQPKKSGAVFTPPRLAAFVAQQMLQLAHAGFASQTRLQVLDPAVGDGALLHALLAACPQEWLARMQVTAFDTDDNSLQQAQQSLRKAYPRVHFTFQQHDFLQWYLHQRSLPVEICTSFDLIIANPPYVRTQALGAQKAQVLAQAFGLSGRVDLYYPFLLAIAELLSTCGIAGLITSNRFMTTRGGQDIRAALRQRFHLHHVWDLGDSKLFAAAVLPAVMLASKAANSSQSEVETDFTSLYSTAKCDATQKVEDIFAGLHHADGSVLEVPDGRQYLLRQGLLATAKADANTNISAAQQAQAVWRLGNVQTEAWLACVERHTWGNFGKLGKIKVGIKSTADPVFIRRDWDTLPGGKPELLRPLLTRYEARRFRAQSAPRGPSAILYPHQLDAHGRRQAVDLREYPLSANYLYQHYARLAGRTYLQEAGRAWYEIWVPHDPQAWQDPKLVFIDIAQEPSFWLDTSGALVNGECYWLRAAENSNPEHLWLALAVANSSFICAWYDHRFNNKLYAGRRRFMSQYVEQFPLPDPSLPNSQALIDIAKRLHAAPEQQTQWMPELEARVWAGFGQCIF